MFRTKRSGPVPGRGAQSRLGAGVEMHFRLFQKPMPLLAAIRLSLATPDLRRSPRQSAFWKCPSTGHLHLEGFAVPLTDAGCLFHRTSPRLSRSPQALFSSLPFIRVMVGQMSEMHRDVVALGVRGRARGQVVWTLGGIRLLSEKIPASCSICSKSLVVGCLEPFDVSALLPFLTLIFRGLISNETSRQLS